MGVPPARTGEEGTGEPERGETPAKRKTGSGSRGVSPPVTHRETGFSQQKFPVPSHKKRFSDGLMIGKDAKKRLPRRCAGPTGVAMKGEKAFTPLGIGKDLGKVQRLLEKRTFRDRNKVLGIVGLRLKKGKESVYMSQAEKRAEAPLMTKFRKKGKNHALYGKGAVLVSEKKNRRRDYQRESFREKHRGALPRIVGVGARCKEDQEGKTKRNSRSEARSAGGERETVGEEGLLTHSPSNKKEIKKTPTGQEEDLISLGGKKRDLM